MDGKRMLKETVLRESILNWYEFRKEGALLNLSREENYLTDLFLRRCKRVMTGNEFKLEEKYDYIVCLDGLEYSNDPVESIRDWMKILKPEGSLLLGVDNRFGLKYFCGVGEKHTGTPFDGINGYMMQEGPLDGKSFSRRELCEILKEVGDITYKFYYPVPDGRMPQMILTDNYQKGINVTERLVDYNYASPSMLGVEHRIFGEMIDEGALPFLSNYFLIEIKKEGILSDIQYAVVTTERGKERAMATTIHEDFTVHKRPIWEEGRANLYSLYTQTKELVEKGIPVVDVEMRQDDMGEYLCMPYIDKEGLSSVLEKYSSTDINRFVKIFDKIYDNIRQSFEKKDKGGKVFLDLAPCNAFYSKNGDEDEILFYDQEFVTEEGTIEYAMFRTIKYFFASSPKARENISEKLMYERYNIVEAMIEEFEEEEARFINKVRNMDQYGWLMRLATPNYDLIKHNMKSCRIEEKPYRVGYVPGVYDLFHVGHLRLLEKCKERCEYLIVGVLTDELVEYYKGKKPVISYENRAGVIRGLSVVDEVIPVDFSNTDKLEAWEQIHYDCHFSGDDHVGHWDDIHEELIKRGSNMEFFPYTKGISSTQIRNKIQR